MRFYLADKSLVVELCADWTTYGQHLSLAGVHVPQIIRRLEMLLDFVVPR